MCKVREAAPFDASFAEVSALLAELSARYETWDLVVASKSSDWALSFRHLLKSSGLSLEAATAAVIILHAWMKESSSRHLQLERLAVSMALSKTPQVELGEFIETHVTAPHLDDLRRILSWLAQSTPETATNFSTP